jgi:malonyl-CoA O-methyltransferase
MTDDSVHKHFGAAAQTYDQHATIQRRAAEELLGRCGDNARRILELGCGTGAYTNLLASAYADAEITAVDFSEEMLRVASENCPHGRVRFVHADLRSTPSGMYDLVTSNAAFQWVPDLDSTLADLHGRLAERGTLAFSYFCPATYRELRSSVSKVVGHPVALPSDDFATPDELRRTLERHYAVADVETVEYREKFPSLRSLLANIKATGTRGAGIRPRIAWTRGLLRDVEAQYRADFGEVVVTYQISFCVARPAQ